jgi:hypothetical protein
MSQPSPRLVLAILAKTLLTPSREPPSIFLPPTREGIRPDLPHEDRATGTVRIVLVIRIKTEPSFVLVCVDTLGAPLMSSTVTSVFFARKRITCVTCLASACSHACFVSDADTRKVAVS